MMMEKRDFKFFLLCVFVILASAFLLTGCVQKEEVVEENDEQSSEESSEKVTENEDKAFGGDFSKFSFENQEIGEISDENYEISFFTENPMNGYHSFVFELDGSDVLPRVLAQHRSEFGAIRLTFQGVEEDKSGLGYQKAYEINEDGIVRIYHNISAEENEEIYDIGITKSAQFYLHSEELENGKWQVTLDVRYPGELEVDIDTGSEEFTTDEQEITGATSSDGAKITNYSYTIEDNVFKFIWSVQGSEEKPVPEVGARYNEGNELVVTFPDLDSDTIGRNAGEMSLIGGLEKVVWNRTEDESVYRFFVGDEKEYRLRSFLSPNQVVLEIEL